MQLKYLILVSCLVVSSLAQFNDPSVKLPRLRGLDKIGSGFDIVKLAQLWSPIELTYMGKSITSPYDGNDYEIPMEIASISTPDVFTNKTTNVSNLFLPSVCWRNYLRVRRNNYIIIIVFGNIFGRKLADEIEKLSGGNLLNNY